MTNTTAKMLSIGGEGYTNDDLRLVKQVADAIRRAGSENANTSAENRSLFATLSTTLNFEVGGD